MILSDLKNYMIEHRVASINDLVMYFGSDVDTVRDMLSFWIRKGKIKQVDESNIKCSKCVQCQMLTTEIYEWVDN